MDTPPILALLSIAGVGGVAFIGLAGAKIMAQRRHDELTRQYVINFPRDLEFGAVLGFIRSLGGIRQPLLARFGGLPTISFELLADASGIHHRLAIPLQLTDFVISQLRGQIPGAHVIPDDPTTYQWDYALELGLTSHKKPLRIPSSEIVINTILASLMPLRPEERVLIQWVVAPAIQEAPDPKDKEHKEKNSETTFLAVGRVASRAGTPENGKRLIRRLMAGLMSVRTYGVAFRSRKIPAPLLHSRVNRQAGALAFPMTLNASELATLIGYPAGGPNVPGLPQGRSRHLAADPMIPAKGFVIGISNFPGAERPLALLPNDLLRHLHIIGPTGVGKTTLQFNLALQQIVAGYGVAVFEPKGDLIADLTNSIPRDRINDVILFDPTDTQYPIGFNVLEGTDPYLAAEQILTVFDRQFGIYSMPRTADIARSGILTLAMANMSLLDLGMLLSPSESGKDFRAEMTRKVKDRGLKSFWEWFDNLRAGEQADAAAPLLRRLRPFELRPSLRAALGQVRSGFDLKEVLAGNKILLVSLSKGQIGEETSALFGALLVSRLWQAVQQRSYLAPEDRTPYFCHIDEFQNYLALPMSIADVLAEARGYGFGLSLAHQNLAQLPTALREGILANARSKVVFQSSARDASALAREFAYLTATDLQNLGAYEVVTRLVAGGQVAPPATATTAPPRPSLGSARAVREASRAAYGRPLADIEHELSERYKTLKTPRKKPSVGWEE